jgi:hypothetical protein
MKLAVGPRIVRLGVAGAAALAFAGSALAYICHPDPPGTRSLTIEGRVDGYKMTGSRVAISYRANRCEQRVVWQPLVSTKSQEACTKAPTRGPAKRVAFDGRLRVVLEKGSRIPDRPDRLAVYDARTGAGLHNWPLPAKASSLDVSRGVAVLSTFNGVYAVRLTDGLFALIGVKRNGDRPQIEPAGAVYEDNRYKRSGGPSAVVTFVPFAGLERRLHLAGPLRVPGSVGDFSMDGRSVIFVEHDRVGRCDHIGLWSIPWHFSTQLMDEPPICPKRHGPGGITALALGGQYLEVITRYGNVQTLISSTMVNCIERVVARTRIRPDGSGRIVRALAADESMMAYANGPQTVTSDGVGRIGLLQGQSRAGILVSDSVPMQLAADRRQLAVLRADGRIDVWLGDRLRRSFKPAGPRALALRAGELTVLTRRRTLDVFSVRSGKLVHSWRVPSGTSPAIQVHFGVAVLSAGRNVFALRLATGRRAVLFHAPAAVAAQINDVGVVYRYNLPGAGFLGYIPFTAVERALG